MNKLREKEGKALSEEDYDLGMLASGTKITQPLLIADWRVSRMALLLYVGKTMLGLQA